MCTWCMHGKEAMYWVHPKSRDMAVSGYESKEHAIDHAKALCERDGSARVRNTETGKTLWLIMTKGVMQYRIINSR